MAENNGGAISVSNEAIDEMDSFARAFMNGEIGGRNDYMSALERILAAGVVTPREAALEALLLRVKKEVQYARSPYLISHDLLCDINAALQTKGEEESGHER